MEAETTPQQDQKPVITSIRLSREAIEKIDKASSREMRSRSNMIEVIISQWIDEHEV
jgi:predicted DNA-binding protein